MDQADPRIGFINSHKSGPHQFTDDLCSFADCKTYICTECGEVIGHIIIQLLFEWVVYSDAWPLMLGGVTYLFVV